MAALGAGALSVVLIAFVLMAALVIHEQQRPRPAVLAQKIAPGARYAISKLIDDYSMQCQCEKGKKCDCAANAANDVRAALRNAVERQFAPPNMYYRSKDGYAFRLRGFQKPQPPVHVDRPTPAPVQVFRRAMEPPAKPKPVERPKPAVVNGLPPIPVSSRFVKHVDPQVFAQAHASWNPPQGAGSAATKVQYFNKAKALQTTELYELPADYRAVRATMLAHPKEAEEADEDEEFFNSEWFNDWMDYSKLILSNGPLEEAEQESHLTEQPTAAVEMPYQLGQEVDFADWDNAYSDDAVVPLRVVDGTESNYPDLDANAGYPEASLVDYAGESGDRQEYANYLVQEAAEEAPAPTSVNGWLRDSPGYRD